MFWKSTGASVLFALALQSQAASISGQGTWETTLQARDLDGNPATVEAFYDTALDITWLANANLAATEQFGVAGIFSGSGDPFVDGSMIATVAAEWISAMNAAGYLGRSDWRLPAQIDTGPIGCDVTFGGTDCGANVDVYTGELAHLFYVTLGNTAAFDTNGVQQPCSPNFSTFAPDYCFVNGGPFANILSQPGYHASLIFPGSSVGFFTFVDGYQGDDANPGNVDNIRHVLPVLNGDIANVVPIPGAVWLLGSALAGLGWAKRRLSGETARPN